MTAFTALALVLALAAIGGGISRLLRQPLVLGYIAAGVLISAFGLISHQREILVWMGQLGVTLLLFLVGLELPIRELKQMGRAALSIGLLQILATLVIAYPILTALGLAPLSALYVALALAFSSTVIVVKLLSEKRDLQSLYGKITVGLLLVQDFVAIGILVVLSGLGTGAEFLPLQVGLVMLKGLGLTALALWLSGQILPKVLAWLGESTEMLFVAAITWCLGIAALVTLPIIGFSLEIGGFLAGLALSGAVQHLQIGARIRPLRDFFLTLFFVSLGANIFLTDIQALWWLAVVISLVVLVVKPIIVLIIMSALGFKKRPAFLVAITGAQISEFSLILLAAAFRVGHVSQSEVTLVAMVGAITMVVSSYLITHANRLYLFLSPALAIFGKLRLTTRGEVHATKLSKHNILIGYNRTGQQVYPALIKLGGEVVVVDFNPHLAQYFSDQPQNFVNGDLSDYDLYEDINLNQAQVVVSTVTDVTDNLQFLNYLKSSKHHPLTIVTAADSTDSAKLTAAGADYVLVPHQVGGELIAHLLSKHGVDKKYYNQKTS